MARTVKCIKLGSEAEGLDFLPYPGNWENVSLKMYRRRLGLRGSSTRLCWSMSTDSISLISKRVNT